LSIINKFVAGIVSKEKLGNFLDTFKRDILGSLSKHINTLKIQIKKNSENVALSIFCPKFKKKTCSKTVP